MYLCSIEPRSERVFCLCLVLSAKSWGFLKNVQSLAAPDTNSAEANNKTKTESHRVRIRLLAIAVYSNDSGGQVWFKALRAVPRNNVPQSAEDGSLLAA